MKTLFISDLNIFDEILEINLNANPNQTFTTTLNGAIYEFDIKTLIDDKTIITIKKDGECLVQCAPVIVNQDLTYLSEKEKGQFFFIKKVNSNLIAFNYSNFGVELALYYGILKTDSNELTELEYEYSLLDNQQELAVF